MQNSVERRLSVGPLRYEAAVGSALVALVGVVLVPVSIWTEDAEGILAGGLLVLFGLVGLVFGLVRPGSLLTDEQGLRVAGLSFDPGRGNRRIRWQDVSGAREGRRLRCRVLQIVRVDGSTVDVPGVSSLHAGPHHTDEVSRAIALIRTRTPLTET